MSYLTSKAMQTTAIGTVANSLPENKVILITLLNSSRYIPYTDLQKKSVFLRLAKTQTPMFTVIGFMLAGIAAGYLSRRRSVRGVSQAITVLIWALLFLLGWEVGSNRQLLEALPRLGGEAFVLSAGGTLGSVLAAWALWKATLRGRKKGGRS